MAKLGVNIDHVATLREVRKTSYPDPAIAAKLAQDSGADLIICHLREDRRHIQDADIPSIKSVIRIPLNLEMAATPAMLGFALQARPDKVTLVPEKRQELTTEGGLEIADQKALLQPFVAKLKFQSIPVWLFIDPEPRQINASLEVGAEGVEFHTGTYCNASATDRDQEFLRLTEAARQAKEQGLRVAAGHGLNYHNILPFQKVAEIEEYNIGHSIVAHAVIVGWERAVREMKALI